MIYVFRAVRPHISPYFEIEAGTLIEAIQNWHMKSQGTYDVKIEVTECGHRESQYFLLVETDLGEQYVSRVCQTGIYRRGGVKIRKIRKKPAHDLTWVAIILEVPVEILTQGTWEGEEQYP